MVDSPVVHLSPIERAERFTPTILQGPSLLEFVKGNEQHANPFIVEGQEMLSLSIDDCHSLSTVLLEAVRKAAIPIGLTADRRVYPLFCKEYDIFVHEGQHVKQIYNLRPHLIAQTSARIFFLEDSRFEGEVSLQAYTFLPYDNERPYTPFEYAQINFAPSMPSKGDYLNICDLVQKQPFEMDEIYKIVQLARTKPQGKIRDYMIAYLLGESWTNRISEDLLLKWGEEDRQTQLKSAVRISA